MKVWHDKKGYATVWISGKSVKVHVLVWEMANGRKPSGSEIHHIDEDKGNYCLENLELLTSADHQRIHAGWVRVDGDWLAKPCTGCNQVLALSQFYPRKGYTPTALCKSCHNNQCTERNKRIPEKRRLYNQRWYAKRKGGDAQ